MLTFGEVFSGCHWTGSEEVPEAEVKNLTHPRQKRFEVSLTLVAETEILGLVSKRHGKALFRQKFKSTHSKKEFRLSREEMP